MVRTWYQVPYIITFMKTKKLLVVAFFLPVTVSLPSFFEMSSSSSSNNALMKCLVYGRSRVDQMTKALPQKCARSHCLIRVKASGLNPVDAKKVIGDKLPDSWKSVHKIVNRRIVEGNIIGFEFSGVVESCPSGLYQNGDQVYGTMPPFGGTLAEYITAPLHQISLKPTSLTHQEAAALPLVGLTCLQALSPYQGCKSIAVIGASGGTGHVAIQVAKCLGFEDIVAVCSSRNEAFVRGLGATTVVCYDKESVVDGLSSSINGYDVIFDCVTSADPRDSRHEYPKKLMHLCKTRYLRLGGESPDWILAGFERYGMRCFGKEKLFWIRFPKSHEDLKQLKEWCDGDGLKPHVSQTFEFKAETVQEAFDSIMERRVQGKVVIDVSGEEQEVVE